MDAQTRIPSNRTLTDEEMVLLSNIFRVVMKDINTDADKHNLAPGEPGIDYQTGVMYIRSPKTGNLITPNGSEKMRLIENHFDVNGNLNAEFVNDLAIYTDLSELPEPLPNLTPDTVVAHMTHVPSLFAGPVEINTGSWPSTKGLLYIIKYDEETVFARYVDQINNYIYAGIYNSEEHLFNRWVKIEEIGPFTICETSDSVNVDLEIPLKPMVSFMVKLPNGLQPNSQVVLNNGDPRPIIDINGDPIGYPIAENNTIMLVYDEVHNGWYLNDSGESATLAGVDMLRRRVSSLNQDVLNLAEYTNERITEAERNASALVDNLRTDTDYKFNNFDASWVKSINGSKLPLNVIPEGAVSELHIVSSLNVLADRSNPGFPENASNGDTIKDQAGGEMYYITDDTVLGTPQYMNGLEPYSSGAASYVDWPNVDHTPTTLAGYGITDAASAADFEALQSRVQQLENELTALKATVNELISSPGNIDLRFWNYIAVGGETAVTSVHDFDADYDKLFINRGQTILKYGIDFKLVGNGIQLLDSSVSFNAGEVVQFIIFKQSPTQPVPPTPTESLYYIDDQNINDETATLYHTEDLDTGLESPVDLDLLRVE